MNIGQAAKLSGLTVKDNKILQRYWFNKAGSE